LSALSSVCYPPPQAAKLAEKEAKKAKAAAKAAAAAAAAAGGGGGNEKKAKAKAEAEAKKVRGCVSLAQGLRESRVLGVFV